MFIRHTAGIYVALALLVCGCASYGSAEDAPPRLEIVSAIYGKAPESADITETIRKAVKGGTYLEFHNHPRWTGKELSIRNEDKKIHLVYKLGGEQKELECRRGAWIKLGALARKFQFGTPEWIRYFLDESGTATALTPYGGNPRIECTMRALDCAGCGKKESVVCRVYDEIPLKCKSCGFEFTEKNLPTTGADLFEGMKQEYHQQQDGKKIYWKPALRFVKAQAAWGEVVNQRKKDPVVGRQRLDAMLAYSRIYRKHMVNGTGTKMYRRGYPLHCNYGRLCHFGDYVHPGSFCHVYRQIEESGVVISPEERAAYRALLEDIISEINLPFIRQWRGMCNPMGAAFGDCFMTGRTFPEAKITDYYTRDEKGNPRVMSGTDLVYETLQGRDGLENLVSVYWYSSGLMHEPSVPYQNMLALGIRNALRNLEGFQPPAGYEPEKHGYKPFQSTGLLSQPQYRLPLNKHLEIVFPNGDGIPFSDGVTRMYNKKPPQESEIYPGWGFGVFRHGNTAAAMNWGNNLVDGHVHNDKLNLLYWGDGLLMLNTTEYPANDPAAPIQYWRNGTGAHNTVMIDGKNHVPCRGNPGAWGVTFHLKVMQGFSDQSHPGAILRRTAFLVNSRSGRPPYLVDFYQAAGGRESHDYFLQAQSRVEEPLFESLEILSPRVTPTGKADLGEVFANAEKKNVYPFIRNPAAGKFNGNAELLWTIPHQGAQVYLHGLLAPEAAGVNTLFAGDAPGIRNSRLDPRDRTVKKVVWRREKASSETTMKNCFIAAFEYAGEKNQLDLKEVKRLEVSGNPESRAVEIVHGSGKDILLLSNAGGKMSVKSSAGDITFDGIAALLSLDRNGTPVKATTVGIRLMVLNGKKISGGAFVTGRLAGVPTGMAEWLADEKNATVAVHGKIPADAAGDMLFVKHKNGTESYKITAVRSLSGNRTMLELDRSARKIIASGTVAPDCRNLEIFSGGIGYGFVAPGDNCIVNGKAYRIKSLDISKAKRMGGKTLGCAYMELEKPLEKSGPLRFPITEFGPDDPFTVMTSKTIDLRQ